MFFIFPVPLWFVVVWIAGGLVFAIWNAIDDASCEREAREDRLAVNKRLEEIEAECSLNAHIAKVVPGGVLVLKDRLRKLAATRGQV